MRAARHYVVEGRVQGVGFRYFTQAAASRESLEGWVRNSLDGTVEAVAQGEAEAIARFERAIGRGPSGSRVDRLHARDLPVDPGLHGFFIR